MFVVEVAPPLSTRNVPFGRRIACAPLDAVPNDNDGPVVIVPFPIIVVEASDSEIMFELVETPTVAEDPASENPAVVFLVITDVPDVVKLRRKELDDVALMVSDCVASAVIDAICEVRLVIVAVRESKMDAKKLVVVAEVNDDEDANKSPA